MENKDKPDWPEILGKLAGSDIDFLVVGGAALVLHGIPRSTMVVDVYIPSDSSELSTLFTLLQDELGLQSRAESNKSLIGHPDLITGQWIPFSIPNGPDIIDVYLCRPGEFYALKKNANMIAFAGTDICVADVDTLRAMKEKCGRAIDLADVALINEYKALFARD